MTFNQDILKDSFLQLINYGEISYINVVITLLITLIIGLFIRLVYRMTFEGVIYQPSFSNSLLLISLVTSMIIMTISSNVVLSLGMVGALSIVRFRAAVKDPKDIAFMFWSIAVGISTGANLFMIAAISSLFIGLVMYVIQFQKETVKRYILVIKYREEGLEVVNKVLSRLHYDVKSKVATREITELTIELKHAGKNTSFVNELSKMPGVENVMLMHYTGDYVE